MNSTALSGLQTYAKLEANVLRQVDLARVMLSLPQGTLSEKRRVEYMAFVEWASQ